ncbi:MAG: sirohydrochlorin cobaltochelatase [Desulfovibrio sp.]|jgi:sirohydrochlorin cobaltochelatase|nr:sirohydrochlorin cobaltochelatase [Desulfovibrio sp.]
MTNDPTAPRIPGRAPARSAAFLLTLLLALLLSLSPSQATRQQPKEALVIAAFGTSAVKARTSYANVEEAAKKVFPGREIRWAWTARSLAAADGRQTPLEALARLAAEGAEDVAVLSLHIIPGQEYQGLLDAAKALEGLPKGLRKVRVAPPLVHDTASLDKVAGMLLETLKERKAGEAAVFVGHGSPHRSAVFYPAMQYYLQRRDANALVGTVEGDMDRQSVIDALQARGVKKVWLAPLMTVAGEHAASDLFGDGEDSWKKGLEAAGFQVVPVRKGLGEYPAFVDRWVSGLAEGSAGSR